MRKYWEAPELWPGSAFVIVAGGPSLTQDQVNACRDRQWRGAKVRIIVVNDGYRVAPWADVLYFCDCKWWQWHAKHLGGWDRPIVRLDGGKYDFGDPRIKVMRNVDTGGLCEQRDGLMTGRDSGYQAMNLAVHLGAKRIVLLGMDMQAHVSPNGVRTHWFGDHPGGTSSSVYDSMLPWFDTLVKPLQKRGVEVINATPGSRIRCFPMRNIQDALREPQSVAA